MCRTLRSQVRIYTSLFRRIPSNLLSYLHTYPFNPVYFRICSSLCLCVCHPPSAQSIYSSLCMYARIYTSLLCLPVYPIANIFPHPRIPTLLCCPHVILEVPLLRLFKTHPSIVSATIHTPHFPGALTSFLWDNKQLNGKRITFTTTGSCSRFTSCCPSLFLSLLGIRLRSNNEISQNRRLFKDIPVRYVLMWSFHTLGYLLRSFQYRFISKSCLYNDLCV